MPLEVAAVVRKGQSREVRLSIAQSFEATVMYCSARLETPWLQLRGIKVPLARSGTSRQAA